MPSHLSAPCLVLTSLVSIHIRQALICGVLLWQAHTPDLLGNSDLFGPLPTMDLPMLQRSESPVPSSKRSSRRSSLLSSKPISSSSSTTNATAASPSACSDGESIHSFSDLLRNSQDLHESPERISVSPEQCGQEGQGDLKAQHQPSIDGVRAAPDEQIAASQPSSSELVAPPTPTFHDPSQVGGAMHADHSGAPDQIVNLKTTASETGTAHPAAPAYQQQASTRSMQETSLLLETPEGSNKAPSGSCQPFSGPLPFSESVMRGAALVQTSLCQQTPLLTLQDGVAPEKQGINPPFTDDVCKPRPNLIDISTIVVRPEIVGAANGTAEQMQINATTSKVAGMSKGLRTVGEERTAGDDAATSENRQAALSRLKSVTRKSVIRGPSFLSQPSCGDVLGDGHGTRRQRPASSPAATKRDCDPPGMRHMRLLPKHGCGKC